MRVARWLIGVSRSAGHVLYPQRYHRALASLIEPTRRQSTEAVIRLRQYQEECVQSVLSYLKDGHKRLGISLATGAGKTVIFTELIDRVKPPNSRATQTLILAHRRELVEQATRHCTRAYPNKSIEIDMGDMHASGVADITVASIRSILSADRLSKYDPARFKLVLVDEAHHIVAPGYMQTLEHFGLATPGSSIPALVGVSATFSRFDGLRLGAAIDHIVYHKDYVDMIGEKWLSDVKFTTIKSNANLARIRSNKNGDFQVSQLSKAVNTDETNEITVKSWMAEAGDRKSTLVFCVDVKHIASLTDTFRQYGIDARYVTGGTKTNIRGQRIDAFRRGEFPVLLNCGVFTEGTDIPNIDCVILSRPTKSRNLLVQMIGRGMRLHPDKVDCHVIDMVASLETGIVTVPTLFGLNPGEVVKGKSSQDLNELKNMRLKDNSDLLLSTLNILELTNTTSRSAADLEFTHYDSVHDLIEDTSGERHVRSISQNAWVQVDSHKYILAAKGGVITLEKRSSSTKQTDSALSGIDDSMSNQSTLLPEYYVIWKHSLPPMEKSKSPWSKPREVATATTLAAALNAADTFASSKFERLFISTSSKWRKEPATEGQLSFLNKLRMVNEEDMLGPEDLTKGQAGAMITKVKFGARGRFDRLIGLKRKVEKKQVKQRMLRAKEHVQVGPLEIRPR